MLIVQIITHTPLSNRCKYSNRKASYKTGSNRKNSRNSRKSRNRKASCKANRKASSKNSREASR